MAGFVMRDELYPLKFAPIYQTRIWGGRKLATLPGRTLPEFDAPVGESWELVDRDNANSVVLNGQLAGKTLHELVRHYGGDLLGARARDTRSFPLLVKLIDAGERLSLQVHPDAEACAKLGGGSEPKTEMWYVLAADKDAKILAGLHGRATRLAVTEKLNTSEIEQQLQVYNSIAGDTYFIPSGTLHAIGAGNLILEIQQNSDTTFRVSDWGRVDAAGKSRELHVQAGLASINFTNRTTPRIPGVSTPAGYNRRFELVDCPYFSATDLRLAEKWTGDTRNASFHLVSATNRPVSLGKAEDPSRMAFLLPGETALVPGCFGEYVIVPDEVQGETVVILTTL